jgi:4-diphosphocytidyl-2-C-methyl-D-erythritol kinase
MHADSNGPGPGRAGPPPPRSWRSPMTRGRGGFAARAARVLAVADAELSTPAVYRRLDQLRGDRSAVAQGGSGGPAAGRAEHSAGQSPVFPIGIDAPVLAALSSNDAPALGALMRNDMQAAALDLCPSLAETLEAGRAAGALGGIVSGSGPTCVFLGRDAAHGRIIAQVLEESGTCRAAEAVVGPATPVMRPG